MVSANQMSLPQYPGAYVGYDRDCFIVRADQGVIAEKGDTIIDGSKTYTIDDVEEIRPGPTLCALILKVAR